MQNQVNQNESDTGEMFIGAVGIALAGAVGTALGITLTGAALTTFWPLAILTVPPTLCSMAFLAAGALWSVMGGLFLVLETLGVMTYDEQ